VVIKNPALEARWHARLDEISAADWDALRADDNPFLSHAFLAGLEQHGCLRRKHGWQPHHLGLYRDQKLVAAAPMYLKGNSHGEFVFDWSWANAYAQNGLDYYPKLLCAVPYSPVTGPRLLCGQSADSDSLRHALLAAMIEQTRQMQLSSAHLNFPHAADAELLATLASEWLPRFDWQFHWHNRGYRDFGDFLDALSAKKRKNIRQERSKVEAAGVRCETIEGRDLTPIHWRWLHRFYLATFDMKGNLPALTADFFTHLGSTLADNVVAVIAYRDAQPIAGALCLRSSSTLYGRYWGCEEEVPGLHFEACYYQGIDYCIRHKLTLFEPGAQGEHKLARGFLPSKTHSFHHIVDSRFRDAIARSLKHEARGLEEYRTDLLSHSPYATPSCRD